tara:strand:+ start:973 stop:1590 length:618 start_codon:yes stop_codon:yes gene_type:complete
MSSKNLIKKKAFFEDIYKNVIGVDEVGRGALCGPVVSCAVILNQNIVKKDLFIEINDSKKININKRILLSEFIKKNSLYSFGLASNKEIDNINILQATILSMKRALYNFKNFKNKIVIDGPKIFESEKEINFIKKGDQKSVSIAAASILAKCHRDDIMQKYSLNHPGYDWGKNKGYGTEKHINALKHLGKTNLHRESFIKNLLNN